MTEQLRRRDNSSLIKMLPGGQGYGGAAVMDL